MFKFLFRTLRPISVEGIAFPIIHHSSSLHCNKFMYNLTYIIDKSCRTLKKKHSWKKHDISKKYSN